MDVRLNGRQRHANKQINADNKLRSCKSLGSSGGTAIKSTNEAGKISSRVKVVSVVILASASSIQVETSALAMITKQKIRRLLIRFGRLLFFGVLRMFIH